MIVDSSSLIGVEQMIHMETSCDAEMGSNLGIA